MSDGNDFNERNIVEFRANHVASAARSEGAPIRAPAHRRCTQWEAADQHS